MKEVKDITSRIYTDALGSKFNMVSRVHANGKYSKSKLKWSYSERKKKMCWTTVWSITGNSKEVLEME